MFKKYKVVDFERAPRQRLAKVGDGPQLLVHSLTLVTPRRVRHLYVCALKLNRQSTTISRKKKACWEIYINPSYYHASRRQ